MIKYDKEQSYSSLFFTALFYYLVGINNITTLSAECAFKTSFQSFHETNYYKLVIYLLWKLGNILMFLKINALQNGLLIF